MKIGRDAWKRVRGRNFVDKSTNLWHVVTLECSGVNMMDE